MLKFLISIILVHLFFIASAQHRLKFNLGWGSVGYYYDEIELDSVLIFTEGSETIRFLNEGSPLFGLNYQLIKKQRIELDAFLNYTSFGYLLGAYDFKTDYAPFDLPALKVNANILYLPSVGFFGEFQFSKFIGVHAGLEGHFVINKIYPRDTTGLVKSIGSESYALFSLASPHLPKKFFIGYNIGLRALFSRRVSLLFTVKRNITPLLKPMRIEDEEDTLKLNTVSVNFQFSYAFSLRKKDNQKRRE